MYPSLSHIGYQLKTFIPCGIKIRIRMHGTSIRRSTQKTSCRIKNSQITLQNTHRSCISIRIRIKFISTAPNGQRGLISQPENILANLRFPNFLWPFGCIKIGNIKILPNHYTIFITCIIKSITLQQSAAPNPKHLNSHIPCHSYSPIILLRCQIVKSINRHPVDTFHKKLFPVYNELPVLPSVTCPNTGTPNLFYCPDTKIKLNAVDQLIIYF